MKFAQQIEFFKSFNENLNNAVASNFPAGCSIDVGVPVIWTSLDSLVQLCQSLSVQPIMHISITGSDQLFVFI